MCRARSSSGTRMGEVRVGRDRHWLPGLAASTKDSFNPQSPETGALLPLVCVREARTHLLGP